MSFCKPLENVQPECNHAQFIVNLEAVIFFYQNSSCFLAFFLPESISKKYFIYFFQFYVHIYKLHKNCFRSAYCRPNSWSGRHEIVNFVPANTAVEYYLLSLTNIRYSVSQQFHKKHENCCLLYSYSFYNTLFFNETVYFGWYCVSCSQWIQGCGVQCTLLSVMQNRG